MEMRSLFPTFFLINFLTHNQYIDSWDLKNWDFRLKLHISSPYSFMVVCNTLLKMSKSDVLQYSDAKSPEKCHFDKNLQIPVKYRVSCKFYT